MFSALPDPSCFWILLTAESLILSTKTFGPIPLKSLSFPTCLLYLTRCHELYKNKHDSSVVQDANLNDAQGEQQHLAQYAEACVLMETLIWAVS